MTSIKLLALLSFLFFASVFASDFSESDNNNLELSNFDDDDFTGDNDENIVYTNMISQKNDISTA